MIVDKKRVCLVFTFGAAVCAAAIGLPWMRPAAHAQEPVWQATAANFKQQIQPLLARYCQRCHSGKHPEADVDLKQFASLEEVRKAPRVWQKVLEMLDTGQMPPKDAKQPAEDERVKLQNWVRDYLKLEARASAGDPGRVVLRRLSNAEYTYTIRDLTGVDSLEPAKEFPVDGAAGEGFTNTGDALSMSPALLRKYLDAAKRIAQHAVLLPDGMRFSPSTTRQDWTNEILAQIRALYGAYSDSTASSKVTLQGLVFDTKQGGRLPVEKYLEATLVAREALQSGRMWLEAVAKERGLSPKYLGLLWKSLTGGEPSLLLDDLRARWRQAKPQDAGALAVAISQWQNALWKFNSVGHIGKVGGPKAWMEPVDPLVANADLRFKIPAAAGHLSPLAPLGRGVGGEGREQVTLYLLASDAGDGNDQDFVVWQQPKFVAPGRPEMLLKDVRQTAHDLIALRTELFADSAKYLAAAEEAGNSATTGDLAELAKKHHLAVAALAVWLDYLGLGSGPARIEGHFTKPLPKNPTYAFIQGWGSSETPLVVANSSDQHVRIPGNMKPHSVAVHPSPKLNAVVAWQSPIAGKTKIITRVVHAHPECGDGVSWTIELRRAATRQRLATGIAQGGNVPKIDPLDVHVKEGDVVALVIGPRSNHSCDLTAVDMTLACREKSWDLAKDVSSDVLAGNPHGDHFGNKAIWHFCSEPISNSGEQAFVIPAGSVLDRWRSATSREEKTRLAMETQKLLSAEPKTANPADAALVRQLAALNGPLLGRLRGLRPNHNSTIKEQHWGLDPALFGRHPGGKGKVDATSLCVKAPSVIEVRLPAELVAGYEFVSSGVIHPDAREQACVQVQVSASKPAKMPSLQPGIPILVAETGKARQRLAAALEQFRELFPPAVCYTKIVPVDEVVTLTLYFREDHQLARLMLDDAQQRKLDRLWEELEYVSHHALKRVDALTQLIEYATQDSDPRPFQPLRKPFQERAAAFRKQLVDTEPAHLNAVLEFAGRAYRRPLSIREKEELTGLYDKLRKQQLPHEEAIRLTLARVLVAPAFLYRLETPGPGAAPVPVSDFELASRLSYFLWSSAPDYGLTQAALRHNLHDTNVLLGQTKRMLQDDRIRRLAIEFGCQWLHIRGFDEMNEKSERLFPTFKGLRKDMYEESILFFTDLFQHDRSVLDILDSDATFVNAALAKHYGIPGITQTGWQRLEGVKKFGRGGILAQATTLATQSGASRTSPILRGNWVYEVLLGEKLPRPPKGVPQLPDDETKTDGLTVRQLIEKHSSDAKCAVCHKKIDAYGFALEGYDAIGRRRDKDLGDRPIETHAKTMDGAEFDGLDGLRNYLLTKRKDAFVHQFCKKLLGYALGRGVQLSDEPLLEEMQERLKANGYRVSVAVEAIVTSRQFREIRGREFAAAE